MEKYWGYELLINAARGNDNIKFAKEIRDFAKELVPAIDMVAYGEPQVVHFGFDDKSGYTLVQLIETSNITGHFCDQTGDFYLNVFSCKTFNPQIVLDLVTKYFKPAKVVSVMLNRDAASLTLSPQAQE